MCEQIRLRREPPLPAIIPPVFHWNLPGEPPAFREAELWQLRVFLALVCPTANYGPTFGAIVSTGEPLSIVPLHRWNVGPEFESCITWLEPRHVYRPNAPTHVPDYPGPRDWLFRDGYAFELGLVQAIAYDNEGNSLRPVPVIARFLTEPSPNIPDPIIGLEHSILTNRLLTRQTSGHETHPPHDPVEWWLREVDAL